MSLTRSGCPRLRRAQSARGIVAAVGAVSLTLVWPAAPSAGQAQQSAAIAPAAGAPFVTYARALARGDYARACAQPSFSPYGEKHRYIRMINQALGDEAPSPPQLTEYAQLMARPQSRPAHECAKSAWPPMSSALGVRGTIWTIYRAEIHVGFTPKRPIRRAVVSLRIPENEIYDVGLDSGAAQQRLTRARLQPGRLGQHSAPRRHLRVDSPGNRRLLASHARSSAPRSAALGLRHASGD